MIDLYYILAKEYLKFSIPIVVYIVISQEHIKAGETSEEEGVSYVLGLEGSDESNQGG